VQINLVVPGDATSWDAEVGVYRTKAKWPLKGHDSLEETPMRSGSLHVAYHVNNHRHHQIPTLTRFHDVQKTGKWRQNRHHRIRQKPPDRYLKDIRAYLDKIFGIEVKKVHDGIILSQGK
jgi:hypothetical protein